MKRNIWLLVACLIGNISCNSGSGGSGGSPENIDPAQINAKFSPNLDPQGNPTEGTQSSCKTSTQIDPRHKVGHEFVKVTTVFDARGYISKYRSASKSTQAGPNFLEVSTLKFILSSSDGYTGFSWISTTRNEFKGGEWSYTTQTDASPKLERSLASPHKTCKFNSTSSSSKYRNGKMLLSSGQEILANQEYSRSVGKADCAGTLYDNAEYVMETIRSPSLPEIFDDSCGRRVLYVRKLTDLSTKKVIQSFVEELVSAP